MAATGFGIALLLRKSREGDGYLSPPKIQNKMGFVFHHHHIFWWQAEKYKKFFDPFPCVEVSRLISISSQKV